ncbi:MAG: hypothetical protein J7L89_06570 [Bacteroidales bacterium]|nr:hypothetical protein [Bacteroidales bacterium]
MKKFILIAIGWLLILPVWSQQLDQKILNAVHYRSIGSSRQGGRYVDFAVYKKRPALFYAAMASGGLWKTENNGISFKPVLDETGAISIGDIAIDQNNPDIVWAGTGEANNSRTAYYGNGIWKSTDGGVTWTNMGLKNSKHIGRIIIHPKNSNIVWVAAEGPLYGHNPAAGVFKTTNGGKSWKKVLSVKRDGLDIGVIDLVIDPAHTNTLYAASYDKERKPWTFNAGGPASAIYKTTNGGASWKKLGGGLPGGILGRIGIGVAPGNPRILYANIENCNVDSMSTAERWELMRSGQPLPRGKREKGVAVYRSDNAGKTWRKVSPDGESIGGSPAYYYQQVRIDPKDANHVYIVGIRVWETRDGGKKWSSAFRFGGDNHALWIDPKDPRHLLLGYDHGMGITYDAGKNWFHPDFKSVGQLVAIGYDFNYPYNVYGGLQDNGSVMGPSTKRNGRAIKLEDWQSTGGGDGMYNVVDRDSRYLYNESQFGPLTRHDLLTGESVSIRYRNMDRWAWSAPIVVSHHNPAIIYHAGNKVVMSTNRGGSWKEISPDLTSADSVKIAGTGSIQYCTIVTMEESYLTPGILWAGTDDGKVWITKNNGKEWTEVTENISDDPGYWVSRVEPSHFDAGTAYVTVTGLRNEDYKPFIWKTTDYGQTWTSIAANLPDEPICVVREHPMNPNLLFVGTTMQIHVSIDGGKTWSSMRSNMPYVAVEDLRIHPRENDLIVGTHGRSFWIADISWLSQITPEVLNADATLFKPETKVKWARETHRMNSASLNFNGESEFPGVPINYFLKNEAKKVTIQIFDGIRMIDEIKGSTDAGINRKNWNFSKRIRKRTAKEKEQMRKQMERFRQFAGRSMRGQSRRGSSDWIMGQADPGEYLVKLIVDGKEMEQSFMVLKDFWVK